ncbi:argininosuccinate synthase [Xenorhabdus sp. M]|uniref:argininosuccinate synthase n=1 Tax=Xenorhabdus szentirmaii TaxID=290112 RepID=A0AAW3YSD4_9GAMM|nr:argininosuccinate synthase [Xenorhabdus sp. M]MBD2800978.1 argininosuccinate synthase [Xenorhabdus sp. M]
MNFNSVIVIFYNRLYNPLVIKELKKNFKSVYSLFIDEGKICDIEEIELECMAAGADYFIYKDYRAEFSHNIIAKAIKANAVYQDGYHLSAALSRPALAEAAVEVAEELGVDYIAHQFRGNDQARMDMNIEILGKKPLASLRNFPYTDKDAYEYACNYGIPLEFGCNNPYSTSENMWGLTIECGNLEHPDRVVPEDVKQVVTRTAKDNAEPIVVSVTFEKGIPVKLNNEEKELHQIIKELNVIGGNYLTGVFDMVEDGIVGLKSRAIYQSPAAHILITAHKQLELFCSNRNENWFKETIDKKWTEMVYSGLWYDPLMAHLNAFIDSMNLSVNGVINLEVGRNYVNVISRYSDTSIYDPMMAIYNCGHLYSQSDSEGFSRIFNIHSKCSAIKKRK